MRNGGFTVYRVLKALVWGVVGILLAVVGLLVFAIIMPFLLRAFLESGSVSQSLSEGARTVLRGLGAMGSAIFDVIIALVVILVLILIGLAILENTPPKPVRRDEAFEALKLRFAKGEITKEQFLEMKKILDKAA